MGQGQLTRRARGRVAALAGVTATATALSLGIGAAPGAAHTHHGSSVRVSTVLSGLNTPRGITFDASGHLYVAESGVAGEGPAGLTHTGRVTKYHRWSTTPEWSRTFDSLYASEDPTQPPDVLGPEGLSALGNSCRGLDHHGREAHRWGKHRHGSKADACDVRLIMSESRDGVLAESDGAIDSAQLGHLYALDRRTGAKRDLSDVGDQMYQWTGDHADLFPDDFPDSNPYGVLVVRDRHRVRTFVADAGANTISEVGRHGTLRVVSYIPNETAPPFRDSTPTCIAEGPDGMLYVATLNLVSLFVNGPGAANVWRVDPNADYPTEPTLWASGLTTATACTFDRQGNFWATEMFYPNATGAPGDLVRIPFRHPDRVTHLAGGQLPLPGGIAQGPDGAMYVTTNSASPEPGSVMRVTTRGHRHHD